MSFPYAKVTWLVGTIGHMRYGSTLAIAKHTWREAIPRTNPMAQAMLLAGGHRAETERAPLDWVRFWLNGTKQDDFMIALEQPYIVSEDLVTGDLIVSLDVRHCPRCHGSGTKRIIERESLRAYPYGEESAQILPIKYVPCIHDKRVGDKLWRQWP